MSFRLLTIAALLILLAVPSFAQGITGPQPTPGNPYAGIGPGSTYDEHLWGHDGGFTNPCGTYHAGGSGPGGGPLIGPSGEPGPCMYWQSENGWIMTIAPILYALLGVLLLMLAIWQGPRLMRSLTLRFSR